MAGLVAEAHYRRPQRLRSPPDAKPLSAFCLPQFIIQLRKRCDRRLAGDAVIFPARQAIYGRPNPMFVAADIVGSAPITATAKS